MLSGEGGPGRSLYCICQGGQWEGIPSYHRSRFRAGGSNVHYQERVNGELVSLVSDMLVSIPMR
jgi:hypothetical protein